MIPGMNPNQLKKIMKMLNAKELDVSEVIFHMSDGSKKKVESPEVTVMNLMGEKIIQVKGELQDVEEKPKITDDDIKLVAEKAQVSEEEARRALEETNGDIAEAILKLTS